MTRLHHHVIPTSLSCATLKPVKKIVRSRHMPQLDQVVHYMIRIQGNIDGAFAGWFGPIQIEPEQDAQGRQITRLTGAVADQAALVGLVRHLHGLGIVLLSVDRIGKE
jgi:hypothetical protein